MDTIEEYSLIGAAILSAQKFEFMLYGVASHLSHLPESKADRRFRNLTPEKFLHGSLEESKATLGQLEELFGDTLLLRDANLTQYIKDRNMIAHNYWRVAYANVQGAKKLQDPRSFLINFIERSDQWSSIMRGLINLFKKTAAEKENRSNEINFNDQEVKDIEAYMRHAANHPSVPKQ